MSSVLDADERAEVESLLEAIEDEGWSVDTYEVDPGEVARTAGGGAEAVGKAVRLRVSKYP